MIFLREINDLAESMGVPTETIEKDYMICWLLRCFAESPLAEHFIFYGGTALKRVYCPVHRFSEDIDLVSNEKFGHDYIVDMLMQSFEYAKKKANIIFSLERNEVNYEQERVQVVVSYDGFSKVVGASKSVRIDFLMNADFARGVEIEKNAIVKSYSDMEDTVLCVYSLHTIFTHKLGMLIDTTRNEPRDLFDVWFLLQRWDSVGLQSEKVRMLFKQRFGFLPSVDLFITHMNNALYRTRWNTRLAKQMVQIPEIDVVVQEIQEGLTKYL